MSALTTATEYTQEGDESSSPGSIANRRYAALAIPPRTASPAHTLGTRYQHICPVPELQKTLTAAACNQAYGAFMFLCDGKPHRHAILATDFDCSQPQLRDRTISLRQKGTADIAQPSAQWLSTMGQVLLPRHVRPIYKALIALCHTGGSIRCTLEPATS